MHQNRTDNSKNELGDDGRTDGQVSAFDAEFGIEIENRLAQEQERQCQNKVTDFFNHQFHPLVSLECVQRGLRCTGSTFSRYSENVKPL